MVAIRMNDCFNPLPHGAHIATDRRPPRGRTDRLASIPYLTGHILQLGKMDMFDIFLQVRASIPYLTGHILQLTTVRPARHVA